MKILMVCLGNICRSPIAEGILTKLTREENLGWHVDSAGTGSWHVGEQPDSRAISICRQHAVDITSQRARQIRRSDLDAFDLILTMDEDNHNHVVRMAQTTAQREKIKTITSYGDTGYTDVPDPYYDGSFGKVYTLLDILCRHIIEEHRHSGQETRS